MLPMAGQRIRTNRRIYILYGNGWSPALLRRDQVLRLVPQRGQVIMLVDWTRWPQVGQLNQ
jgi:hypothetical protein